MNGLKEFKTNLKQILGNKLLGINSYEYVNHSVVKLFVNKANAESVVNTLISKGYDIHKNPYAVGTESYLFSMAGLKHNADYLIRVNFKSV